MCVSGIAGAQAPSVESYVVYPTPVDQSYFNTGTPVAQGPAAYPAQASNCSVTLYLSSPHACDCCQVLTAWQACLEVMMAFYLISGPSYCTIAVSAILQLLQAAQAC